MEYTPDADRVALYDDLYKQYKLLGDFIENNSLELGRDHAQ